MIDKSSLILTVILAFSVSNAWAVNRAPTALGGSARTAVDQPVVIGLNATDLDGDALTFSITQSPPAAQGSVVLTAEGDAVVFIPATGFVGAASFRFKANDGERDSHPANVTVIVQTGAATNRAPAADAVQASATMGETVTVPLSGLDPDVGDTLNFEIASTPPAHQGTVVISGDEATFTPAPNFTGVAFFSYKAVDSSSLRSAAAQVRMIYTAPVNATPTAGNATHEIPNNLPVSFELLGEDADGDSLTYNVVQIFPSNSGAISSPEGSLVIFTPSAGFTGIARVRYQAHDGTIASNLGEITLNILAFNGAPTVEVITEDKAAFNQPVTTDLQASDGEGDALTFAITQPANGGSVTLRGDQATFTPDTGIAGTTSYTYTATDPWQTSTPATVTITINTPPTADDIDEGRQLSDAPVTIMLQGADADGDALTYSVDQPATGGTVTLSGDQATFTPDAGFGGPVSFTYRAEDGLDSSSNSNVTLTINTAPTADAQSVTTAYETPIAITLSGNDADGDAITFSIVSGPGNGSLGTISGDTVTYTPNDGFSGIDSFTYKANDGTDDSTVGTVTIEVAENTPPVADPVVDQTTDFETPLTLTLTGSDSESSTVGFAVDSPPPVAEGSLSLDAGSGESTFTPAAGFSGSTAFSFVVNDGSVNSAPQMVKITVGEPSNTAPVVQDVNLNTAYETPLAVTLEGSDDEGDPLTFSIDSPPGNGTLSVISGNTVTYTPEAGYHGPDSFTYITNDGTENSNSAIVSITVEDRPNVAPVVQDIGDQTPVAVPFNGDVEIALIGSDDDNDPLTFSVVSGPGNGTLGSISGNTVTYTPSSGYNGPDTFIYKANDGREESNNATVTVSVAPNTPPEAVDMLGLSTPFNTPLEITLEGSDADGDELTFRIVGVPETRDGTLELVADGVTVTFTPAEDFETVASGGEEVLFRYVSNDGTDDSAEALVNIMVESNQAPELSFDVETGHSGVLVPGEDATIHMFDVVDPDDLSETFIYEILNLPFDAVLLDEEGNSVPVGGEVIVEGDSYTFTLSYDPPVSTTNSSINVEIWVSDPSGVNSPVYPDRSTQVLLDIPVNYPPTLTVPPGLTTDNQTPLNITLSGEDVESNPADLMYNILTQPMVEAGMVEQPVLGFDTMTFTPEAGFEGTAVFEVDVCDDITGACSETDTISVEVTAPVIVGVPSAGILNDTGVLFSGTVMEPWANNSACSAVYGSSGANLTPAQDCSHGRDVAVASEDKIGSGHGGFDFTRVKNDGTPLTDDEFASGHAWSCVQDNHTGLMWEVKQGTGLHRPNDTFTWYNTDYTTNGDPDGAGGVDASGSEAGRNGCFGYEASDDHTYCNTQAFVMRVNDEELCGYDDWRLPHRQELRNLVHYDRYDPAVDLEYFPGMQNIYYWSSTPFAGDIDYAWYIDFYDGFDFTGKRSSGVLVRLVRGAQ